MFAIIAAICFFLTAIGFNNFGPVALGWLGLFFLAIHLAYPVFPIRRRFTREI